MEFIESLTGTISTYLRDNGLYTIVRQSSLKSIDDRTSGWIMNVYKHDPNHLIQSCGYFSLYLEDHKIRIYHEFVRNSVRIDILDEESLLHLLNIINDGFVEALRTRQAQASCFGSESD